MNIASLSSSFELATSTHKSRYTIPIYTFYKVIMEILVVDLGVSVETSHETLLIPFADTIAEYLDLGHHRTACDIELMKILRHQMLFTEIASPESITRSSLEGLAQGGALSLGELILACVLKLSHEEAAYHGEEREDVWILSHEDDVAIEVDRVCRNLCIPNPSWQSETDDKDNIKENYLGLDYLVCHYAQMLMKIQGLRLGASKINPNDAIADIRQSVILGYALEDNRHSLQYANGQESLHVCYMDLVRFYLEDCAELELDGQSLDDKMSELLDRVVIEEPRDPFWYMYEED